MGLSKEVCQYRHALKRAHERYGVDLKEHEYFALVAQITGGNSKFLLKQSHRVTVHEVTHNGIKMTAVYDSKRNRISTFLPPGLSPDEIYWYHG